MATPAPTIPTRQTDTLHTLPDTPARAFVRGMQEGSIIGRHRRELAQELLGDLTSGVGGILARIPVPAVFERAKAKLDFSLLGTQLRGMKAKNKRTLKKMQKHKVGVPRPGGLATPEQIKRQMEQTHPQDRGKPRGTQEHIPRAQTKNPTTRRAPVVFDNDIRRGPASGIPGIRATVGARSPVTLDIGFGQTTFPGGNPFWASEYLERRFPSKRSAVPNRRGAAATRPLSRSAVPGRTGAGSTRPLAIPGTVPGSVPAGVPGGAPAPVPTRSSTEGVPGRRSGGLATRERSTTGHAKDYVDLSKVAQGYLSQQLNTFMQARPGRQATRLLSPGAIAPLPRVITPPVVSPTQTAVSAMAPGVSLGPQASSRSKSKDCNCEDKKPKQKEFPCSNPLVSRSVTKDGVITIKRKLQCQPSRRK